MAALAAGTQGVAVAVVAVDVVAAVAVTAVAADAAGVAVSTAVVTPAAAVVEPQLTPLGLHPGLTNGLCWSHRRPRSSRR